MLEEVVLGHIFLRELRLYHNSHHSTTVPYSFVAGAGRTDPFDATIINGLVSRHSDIGEVKENEMGREYSTHCGEDE
jgi:hypothetical protein